MGIINDYNINKKLYSIITFAYMKITWINFLHFYQPATSDNETIIEATEKSYKRIISALLRNRQIKFTLNITGCLLERWPALGYDQLIADIIKLLSQGQIELTDSAAFHPILPLLPSSEIERSTRTNRKLLEKYFGKGIDLNGFFSPEAAYSLDLSRLIKKTGYQWLVLDEITAKGKLNTLDFSQSYEDDNSGLKLCFRSRELSKSYVPQAIFNLIKQGRDVLAVTATDAELYGLRHQDHSAGFEKLLKRPEIKTLTISQYLAQAKNFKKISPIASSWESTEAELKLKLPYALWYNKKNKIQTLLWQLANLAIITVNRYKNDEKFTWARSHLDKGLSSCTFWWASARDFKLFGSISWNPDEIERGLDELVRSVRALVDPASKQTKIKAEKLYIKIKQLIWHKHWTYYWNKTLK